MIIQTDLVSGELPGDRANYKNTCYVESLNKYVGEYDGPVQSEHTEYTGRWPVISIDSKPLTQYEFRSLFTPAAKLAIDRVRANINDATKLVNDVPNYGTDLSGYTVQDALRTLFTDMDSAPTIRRSNAGTQSGLDLLIVAGLISSDEKESILYGEVPQ